MAIKTEFLVISDTHGEDVSQIHNIPADVAIHCGDLTEESKIHEFRDAIELLKKIQAPLKLVIAGNHDFTLDQPTFRANIKASYETLDPDLVRREFGEYGEAETLFEDAKAHGIHFLHEGTHHFELDNGALLTVYASPFTPTFYDTWGFHYHPQQPRHFDIPNGVDLVVTHGPPHGIMDTTATNQRIGCPSLFGAIARAQPKLHCFGHAHSGWGAKLVAWREQISEVPSHFSDINNDRSLVIEKLPNLKKSKFDGPGEEAQKAQRRSDLARQGYIKAGHCADDERPLQQGETFFVNAAIEGTSDEYPRHVPWLVDIELPSLATSETGTGC